MRSFSSIHFTVTVTLARPAEEYCSPQYTENVNIKEFHAHEVILIRNSHPLYILPLISELLINTHS